MFRLSTSISILLLLGMIPFAFSTSFNLSGTPTVIGAGGGTSASVGLVQTGEFDGTWDVVSDGTRDPWTDFHLQIQVADGTGGFRSASLLDGVQFLSDRISFLGIGSTSYTVTTQSGSPSGTPSSPSVFIPSFDRADFYFGRAVYSSTVALAFPMQLSSIYTVTVPMTIRLFGQPSFAEGPSIPEPATGVLLLTGVGAAALFARWRKRKDSRAK